MQSDARSSAYQTTLGHRRGIVWHAAALLSFASLFAVGSAFAQAGEDFPTRPVQMVVPLAPGGGTDVMGRRIAAEMAKKLGQNVYVENRPGANSIVGTDFVAKSEPDGYTILFVAHPPFVVAPHMGNPPYNPLTDFAPITVVHRAENVLAASADSPINTLQDLIDLSVAEPGKFTYGTSGIGGATHLQGELLQQMGGFTMTHVPYQGTAPAITGALSGEVDLVFGGIPAIAPLIESGQLKALGVTGADRSSGLPDVPTIGETVTGYANTSWFGLYAPAGTPRPVVDKIRTAVLEAMKEPSIIEAFKSDGARLSPTTPEELQKIIEDEYTLYGELIKSLDIKP